MSLQPKLNPGTLTMRHLFYTPPLTISLGCVVHTCPTVVFVLYQLDFFCLVLHLTPIAVLCHVSLKEGSARRDDRNIGSLALFQQHQYTICGFVCSCYTYQHASLACSQILDVALLCRELAFYWIILNSICKGQQLMNTCTLCTAFEHDKACVEPGIFIWQRILIVHEGYKMMIW